MTRQHDYHAPTDEERDMLNVLVSGLKELGEFDIRSVELLFDEPSSLLVSVKTPSNFETAGSQMTAIHSLAQDISDRFSRNIVITTSNFTEGGQKVSFNQGDFERSNNVVALNPNKPDLDRLKIPAAASPKHRSDKLIEQVYLLDNACAIALQYVSSGHVHASATLLDRLSFTATVLIEKKKVSLNKDEVHLLCLDIINLYIAHNRINDAEMFIDKICAHSSSTAKEQFRTKLALKVQSQENEKMIVKADTKALLAQLDKLLEE